MEEPPLFTKFERGEDRPLRFHLHIFLPEDQKAVARMIVEENGGSIVTTEDQAEIVVADRRYPEFTELDRKFGREAADRGRKAKRRAVESLDALHEWIEEGFISYNHEKLKKRGGRPVGSTPRKITNTDEANEATYVASVYQHAKNAAEAQELLGSQAHWRRMSALPQYAWMNSHPASTWSRRHREPPEKARWFRRFGHLLRNNAPAAPERGREDRPRLNDPLDDPNLERISYSPEPAPRASPPRAGAGRHASLLVHRTPTSTPRASADPYQRPQTQYNNRRDAAEARSAGPSSSTQTRSIPPRTPGPTTNAPRPINNASASAAPTNHSGLSTPRDQAHRGSPHSRVPQTAPPRTVSFASSSSRHAGQRVPRQVIMADDDDDDDEQEEEEEEDVPAPRQSSSRNGAGPVGNHRQRPQSVIEKHRPRDLIPSSTPSARSSSSSSSQTRPSVPPRTPTANAPRPVAGASRTLVEPSAFHTPQALPQSSRIGMRATSTTPTAALRRPNGAASSLRNTRPEVPVIDDEERKPRLPPTLTRDTNAPPEVIVIDDSDGEVEDQPAPRLKLFQRELSADDRAVQRMLFGHRGDEDEDPFRF